jgi:hypothetical protein
MPVIIAHQTVKYKMETWLKETKIDFPGGEDLKRLFIFLQDL